MMKARLSIATAAVAALVATGAQAADGSEESDGFYWDGAPAFRGDGWNVVMGGRVQLDYSFVDADNSGGEWRDGELRRLRLGFAGKFGDNVKLKVEVNAESDGNVDLEDGYIQWAPTRRQMECQNRPIQNAEFSRRTDIIAFHIGRWNALPLRMPLISTGVLASASTLRATIIRSLPVFLVTMSIYPIRKRDYAVAARGTVTPVKGDEILVHLGASVRYRSMGDSQGDIRYRQRPVSHIPGRNHQYRRDCRQ